MRKVIAEKKTKKTPCLWVVCSMCKRKMKLNVFSRMCIVCLPHYGYYALLSLPFGSYMHHHHTVSAGQQNIRIASQQCANTAKKNQPSFSHGAPHKHLLRTTASIYSTKTLEKFLRIYVTLCK